MQEELGDSGRDRCDLVVYLFCLSYVLILLTLELSRECKIFV